MSRFEHTSDDCEVICPYCEYSYQREAEDYDRSERVEECEDCGKHFVTYDDFSVTHFAMPDCGANDEEHAWACSAPGVITCGVCGKNAAIADRDTMRGFALDALRELENTDGEVVR